VLVVSTGRTGTQALAHIFDGVLPGVHARHEPPPSRRLRILSNLHLCGRLGRARLQRHLTRVRGPLLDRLAPLLYLESNPFLHGFLDVFDDVFGAPRVLHVVRDPRTYVVSYLRFGVFRGAKGLAAAWLPYWMLKPERYEPDSGLVWARMSPTERLAWRWNAVNGALERGEQLFGARYRRVRFENLFAPDGTELHELARWMGLHEPLSLPSPTQARANASPNVAVAPFADWPAAEQRRLLSLCGARMERYGYR